MKTLNEFKNESVNETELNESEAIMKKIGLQKYVDSYNFAKLVPDEGSVSLILKDKETKEEIDITIFYGEGWGGAITADQANYDEDTEDYAIAGEWIDNNIKSIQISSNNGRDTKEYMVPVKIFRQLVKILNKS